MIAVEVKLRAERKAGQFLMDMKSKGELVPHKRPKGNVVLPSLADLGVEKFESSRWQRFARIRPGPVAGVLEEGVKDSRAF